MWDSTFWSLPLAVFIPSVLIIGFGVAGIRSVLAGMKEISAQILTWHGSQESIEMHEKMWKKFLESDHFREKLNEHVKHNIDNALTPLNLKMDLLDRNVQIATNNLAKEVREEMYKIKTEVIAALSARDTASRTSESS